MSRSTPSMRSSLFVIGQQWKLMRDIIRLMGKAETDWLIREMTGKEKFKEENTSVALITVSFTVSKCSHVYRVLVKYLLGT